MVTIMVKFLRVLTLYVLAIGGNILKKCTISIFGTEVMMMGIIGWQHIFLKSWHLLTSPHSAKTQKNTISLGVNMLAICTQLLSLMLSTPQHDEERLKQFKCYIEAYKHITVQ